MITTFDHDNFVVVTDLACGIQVWTDWDITAGEYVTIICESSSPTSQTELLDRVTGRYFYSKSEIRKIHKENLRRIDGGEWWGCQIDTLENSGNM